MHIHFNEKLRNGYQQMLIRLKSLLHEVGTETKPALIKVIELAKDKAIALEELTEKEAEQVTEYLKRDLQQVARFMVDAECSFQETIAFDKYYLEESLLQFFLQAADRAKVEMAAFNLNLTNKAEYHSGEITGIGTLQCTGCNELLHFYEVSVIDSCPNCHHSVFRKHLCSVAGK